MNQNENETQYDENTEDQQELKKDDSVDGIRELGSVTAKGKKDSVHCLTIVGQVEGHMLLPPQNKTTKYEHVMPQLAAIEESEEIDGLLILLNTVGGDVEAGLAIAELIAGMKKPTVSLVLGGGHSIGVPLAVASRRSFIAPTASMTIHPVRMTGTVLGVPQTMTYFEKIQDRITDFVVANSHIKEEDFRRLMMENGQLLNDVGSIVYGREAVKLGLIDELGSLHDALSCLHQMIEEEKKDASHDRSHGTDLPDGRN
ncbi:ClpP family protease [Acidaminobacterium chupaoyuni]